MTTMTGRGPWAVIIPGRPPTPNARRHWRLEARDAKEWRSIAQATAEAALAGSGPWEPIRRCRMEVTFIVSQDRPRDLDNLVASSKPLTDGLVDAGVLVDDSTRVIEEATYRVRHQPGVQATLYRITPLEPLELEAGL